MGANSFIKNRGMPPKRKQMKGKKTRRGGARNTFRVTGTAVSWNIQQTTSGNGGFSANESKGPYSASNAVIINPFDIGGRLYYFASLFDEWKVNRLRFTYTPLVGPNGQISTPTGAQNSGGYFHRNFAMCFVADAATSVTGYNGCVDAGGVQGIISRKCVLSCKGYQASRWLYTSTSTSSSITSMDYRQTSPGNLCFAFADNSTTNNVTYGNIRVDWDVTFRSPLTYGNPLGMSAPQPSLASKPTSSSERDEQKSDTFSGGLDDDFLIAITEAPLPGVPRESGKS